MGQTQTWSCAIVFTESPTESVNPTQEAPAPTQTATPPACTHTHINKHAKYTNCNLHMPSFLILNKNKIKTEGTTVQFPRCTFDLDLSSMLILSGEFIFILLWPAAVVVEHDAASVIEKNERSPYHTRPQKNKKGFSFEKDGVYASDNRDLTATIPEHPTTPFFFYILTRVRYTKLLVGRHLQTLPIFQALRFRSQPVYPQTFTLKVPRSGSVDVLLQWEVEVSGC